MFNRKSKLFNIKAFSLIELMVVVAIIGILAAIGIPQYSKFQAKTRQSEAKGALATLYAAEVSFAGEWNQYSVDLRNIGFGVAGTRLRYMTGFTAGTGCTQYVTTGGAPTEATTLANTWSCGANVNVSSTTQAQAWALPSTITVASNQCTVIGGTAMSTVGTPSVCDSTTGQQRFTAVSVGDPNANVGTIFLDAWTINQLKSLSNSTPGIQ